VNAAPDLHGEVPLRGIGTTSRTRSFPGHPGLSCGTMLVSLAVIASAISLASHSCFGLGLFSPAFNGVCTWRIQLMDSPTLAT
jgi:hypothetical protein